MKGKKKPWAKKAFAEGRSPLQELEVGSRSGPYLLVSIITLLDFEFSHKLVFEFVIIWHFYFFFSILLL